MVGFFIFLSRAFGFIRDIAMAALFGSSLAMDAFVVAFTIPNLFRGLFGEGALSSSFVPVFSETIEKQGQAQVWSFARNMFSFLSLTLAALVATIILLASLAIILLPLSPRIEMILELLRIMLPYMFFICLTAFFSAMLNALRRFMLPAATPVTMNIVMIAALWFVCPYLPVEGDWRIIAVAWSVIVAGLIQAVMQLPLLARMGFRLAFSADWGDPRTRRVWQLMGAAMLGVGITQVNVLLNRLVAVFIGLGAASYLYYAERLIYFPLGIFATALGTILLPTLSGHAARNRNDLILDTLNHSLRQIIFIMLPAAVGMLVLAEPIVRLAYERGDFSSLTTKMTTIAVQCYAPGLLVFSLIKVLIPAFYARQDMRTPVRIGLICTGINIGLMLLLLWPLKHAGIALATVISTSVNVIMLGIIIHRRIGSPGWGEIIKATGRMSCAAALMALTAIFVYRSANITANGTGVIGQIIPMFCAMSAAIIVYLAATIILRCREPKEWLNALRYRARSNKARS